MELTVEPPFSMASFARAATKAASASMLVILTFTVPSAGSFVVTSRVTSAVPSSSDAVPEHVVDSANRPIAPQQVAVLAGTLTLAPGRGQEISVDAVNVATGYPNGPDAALLHLATPTASPPVALAQLDQAALWAPGTRAFVAGWGDTGEDAGDFPVDARQVSLPVISDSRCRSVIGAELVPARELCAGAPAGKVDSCQGDSGGPLAVPTGSGPVLIGVVSWGYGCARPNTPGMYARVSALSGWVQSVTGAPALSVALPAAPTIRVRPRKAIGRRGRTVDLSYVLAGQTTRSSEYVAILNGKGRILADFETDEGGFTSNQDVFYVRWRLPRSAPRTLYFCVAAAPPGTDYGEPGCARIIVRSAVG